MRSPTSQAPAMPESSNTLSPTDCLLRFVTPWFTNELNNRKGRPQAARISKLSTANWVLSTAYRPAPAAFAAGIIPAIFILSIRFSTFSMLAPVSTHAST